MVRTVIIQGLQVTKRHLSSGCLPECTSFQLRSLLLSFMSSYSSEWTFSKALKFFTMVHIVTIDNIISMDSMRPLGHQGYDFTIMWEEADLIICTELFQHLPRMAEKIHECL